MEAARPKVLHALANCQLIGGIDDISRSGRSHIDSQIKQLSLHFATFVRRRGDLVFLFITLEVRRSAGRTNTIATTTQPVEGSERILGHRKAAASKRTPTSEAANHHASRYSRAEWFNEFILDKINRLCAGRHRL